MGRSRRPKPKHLAKKLKQIRLELGWSQVEMAKQLKPDSFLHPGHISEFENDKRERPLPLLSKYAQLADVYVDDLIDDSVEL